MDDLVIPLVFPAYLIAVPRPGVDLPAWMNGMGVPDLKPATERVPDLGHAGALFINGKTGLTKYYEFGRYDPEAKGLVQTRSIPDIRLGLKSKTAIYGATLDGISKKAGQGGRVRGAMIPVPGKFADMLAFAEKRRAQNSTAARKSYDLLFNSCVHFAREVAVAGGASLSEVLDPRPIAYIDSLIGKYSEIAYDPRTKVVE